MPMRMMSADSDETIETSLVRKLTIPSAPHVAMQVAYMKNGHSGWMLYGAYGTTGELILEEALRRGHRPLLAGRNPLRLSDLSLKTGLDALAFDVDSARDALPALEGVSLVVNAAGPFFETGGPLRRLCLEARASYVDVNGEIGDFVAAMECDAEA